MKRMKALASLLLAAGALLCGTACSSLSVPANIASATTTVGGTYDPGTGAYSGEFGETLIFRDLPRGYAK